MHVPCPACGTINRFKSPSSDSTSVLVDCPGCQGRFRVAIQVPETKGDPESYRLAREYAREHDIDIATAYSVLEGLLTLEEARGAGGALVRDPAAASSERDSATAAGPMPGSKAGTAAGSPASPPVGSTATLSPAPAPPKPDAARSAASSATPPSPPKQSAASSSASSSAPPAPPPPRTSSSSAGVRRSTDNEVSEGFSYDAGFEVAVRDGCLTAKQAIERGDRHALATRLSTRHSLPMDLAFQAADNRITIRQAVQQKVAREAEGKSAPPGAAKRSKGGWRFAVYGVGGLLLIVAGMALNVMLQRPPVSPAAPTPSVDQIQQSIAPPEAPPPSTPAPPPARTVPKVDHAGQLVEVEGPDPMSVLVSFCDSGALAGQRKPVEIVETTPVSSGWRLGIFSSASDRGSSTRAIRIRKDTRTSHWVVGDGRTPIQTEAFGSGPQGAPRGEASSVKAASAGD